MDSESIGDRLKEIQISECDNVEIVPKILSPEIHDVFNIFASMLDIASFIRLALTCKEMYKRCMEDKSIRINVDRLNISVRSRRLQFSLCPFGVGGGLIILEELLPCKVNVPTLTIHNSSEDLVYMGSMVQRMKEYGINKIDRLIIRDRSVEGDTIIEIIKEFGVKSVDIFRPVEPEVLRSILQMNLDWFFYDGPVTANLILEIDFRIKKIFFLELDELRQEEFMDFSSRIQSGALRKLIVGNWEAVDWRDYAQMPYDHEGPLPEERPLLLAKTPVDDLSEYWFLHWNGGVTKCAVEVYGTVRLEMYKCEPWEVPYILRKKEDILKDLAEKRPKVSCTANHFRAFCMNFTMIDASHKGPLPHDRPLYFKVSENRFWMLDEDDNLMECWWDDDCAIWMSFNPFLAIGNSSLAKYIFWKSLNKMEEHNEFNFFCKGSEEFHSWFDDFEKPDFNCTGVLPRTRPLVFEGVRMEENPMYAVLLDDRRLLQCEFIDNHVKIEVCHYSNRPPILFTFKHVVEMLEDRHDENMNFNISFDIFRDGFRQLKKSIWVLKKRLLIFETTKTEFWYLVKDVVRKVEWADGQASISIAELHESPPSFMKMVFRYFAQDRSATLLNLNLKLFNSCLEQFNTVPFEYSGPLTSDSPLAFVKNGKRHNCGQRAICECRSPLRLSRRRRTNGRCDSCGQRISPCNCKGIVILVWFLCDGVFVTKCSWGEFVPKKVRFRNCTSDSDEVPPVLRSKEYLKNLLQAEYSKSSRYEWFGCFEDFYVLLSDYLKLPFDHDGPLPEERPLVFEANQNTKACLVLREDGAIIKCECHGSHVSLSLLPPYSDDVPPALQVIY